MNRLETNDVKKRSRLCVGTSRTRVRAHRDHRAIERRDATRRWMARVCDPIPVRSRVDARTRRDTDP
jgi:hypothetical protein